MSNSSLDIQRTTGKTCAHCGQQQRGSATIKDLPVCNTGGPFPDCYELVTTYGEHLGVRNPSRALALAGQKTSDMVADQITKVRSSIWREAADECEKEANWQAEREKKTQAGSPRNVGAYVGAVVAEKLATIFRNRAGGAVNG